MFGEYLNASAHTGDWGKKKRKERRGRSISLQKAMNKYLFLNSVQGWDAGVSQIL